MGYWERSRTGIIALALFVVLSCPSPTVIAQDQAPVNDLYAAVIPGLRENVATAAGDLSSYDLNARLDPATSTIGGRVTVTFVNRTGERLNETWFRLFPNAAYYNEGGTTVESVRVGATTASLAPVLVELAVVETALRVPLTAPLAPGQRVAIEIRFTTTIPTDSTGSYGILNHDTAGGTWVLADWYPSLAGYEPGTGWRIDTPTAFGDPTFADAALYDVTLSAPAALTLVTTGSQLGETRSAANDGARRRYVTGPARDFTLVADDDYVAERVTVGETVVTSYANPATAAANPATLAATAAALTAYGDRYGAYPFTELDLIQAPLGGALGVSWAGIAFLDGPRLAGPIAAEDPERFAFVVAHEVGHLWWGASVGANTNDHPFMVEGLTNYISTVYAEDTLGPDLGAAWLERFVAQGYRATLADAGDAIADTPFVDGQNAQVRSAVLYGKAALGFHAIRREIGDAAFFGALRVYADDFAFRIAEPGDLRAAFETSAGRDLGDLWRFWFEAAETTVADVDRVLAA